MKLKNKLILIVWPMEPLTKTISYLNLNSNLDQVLKFKENQFLALEGNFIKDLQRSKCIIKQQLDLREKIMELILRTKGKFKITNSFKAHMGSMILIKVLLIITKTCSISQLLLRMRKILKDRPQLIIEELMISTSQILK